MTGFQGAMLRRQRTTKPIIRMEETLIKSHAQKSEARPLRSQSPYRVGSGRVPPRVGPPHSSPEGPGANISTKSSSSSSSWGVPQPSVLIGGFCFKEDPLNDLISVELQLNLVGAELSPRTKTNRGRCRKNRESAFIFISVKMSYIYISRLFHVVQKSVFLFLVHHHTHFFCTHTHTVDEKTHNINNNQHVV